MDDLQLDPATIELIAQTFFGKKCYICGRQATNIIDKGHKIMEYACLRHVKNGQNKEKYISPRNIVVVNSLDLPNDWNEEYGECYQ